MRGLRCVPVVIACAFPLPVLANGMNALWKLDYIYRTFLWVGFACAALSWLFEYGRRTGKLQQVLIYTGALAVLVAAGVALICSHPEVVVEGLVTTSPFLRLWTALWYAIVRTTFRLTRAAPMRVALVGSAATVTVLLAAWRILVSSVK